MRQLTMLEQRACGSNVKKEMTVHAVPKKESGQLTDKKKSRDGHYF